MAKNKVGVGDSFACAESWEYLVAVGRFIKSLESLSDRHSNTPGD